MARVGRLGGAILVDTDSEAFLVGNTKRPCDWAAAGFEAPGELDAVRQPYVRLARSGPLNVPGPWLDVSSALDGEEVARRVANRLLIERNGSVSDRLWRLILRPQADAEDDPPPDALVDGRWLVEMPAHLWQIVREQVLRCL